MQRFLVFILILHSLCSFAQLQPSGKLQPGVSRMLADQRSALLSEIHYDLFFDIPGLKSQPITAKEILTFNLKSAGADLVLDFKATSSQLTKLKVNGKEVPAMLEQEHLILSAGDLLKGLNKIEIEFRAGDYALNRNEDYLYTLFVPDRARTVFPCFDQPNLKAVFKLQLKVPEKWNVLANGALVNTIVRDGYKTWVFNPSDKISTYLFSFAAGKFTSITGNGGQPATQFLYRETDPGKIKNSVDSIFNAHADAVSFLSSWTKIPYPFQKIGFVSIPDFQFGGMEHVGAIQYKSSTLFLDAGATKDQYVSRSNLISHELAHMWFGDLVSIDWFNDVWMKEVFANFMADKVTEKLTGTESFNLKFLTDHFPAAYSTDRSGGANPIRQDLVNLNQAGSLYGNIIYHKAPIIMRQLERLMGKDKFQEGIQAYLKKFAYGNATWPDLINILNQHASTDLIAWDKVWVNDTGRPVIDYEVQYSGGKISRLTLKQTPERGPKRIWTQHFEIALVYPGHVKELSLNMSQEIQQVLEAKGLPKPEYILFNSSGMGYGVWPTDPAMLPKVYSLKSPVMRASAYISLYENMLNGRGLKPQALLDLFTTGLEQETNGLNLNLIVGYMNTIFWTYTTDRFRQAHAAVLEDKIWKAMEAQTVGNNKKLLFKAYQNVFLNRDAYDRLERVWKDQVPPAGVKLAEDDYTSLSFSLALRKFAGTGILPLQLKRISNVDMRKRFEFIAPALSADEKERDAFFDSLADRKNRQKEAYVNVALSYLHHPLRQETSKKYLKKTLDMLEEIQQTGDIFFPQSWLKSSFSSYQRQEALQVINDFIKEHPDYNRQLMMKILQAADPVIRAQKLVE